MTDRDTQWATLVRKAYEEGLSRGFHHDEHEHVIDVGEEWRKSESHKAAGLLANETNVTQSAGQCTHNAFTPMTHHGPTWGAPCDDPPSYTP